MKREWLLFILAFFFSLLLIEGLIRGYYALSHKVPPHWDDSLYEEWTWASAHLAAGDANLPGEATYDPELGWVKKPHLDLNGVRTNSVGMRSDREFTQERIPGTGRILFVGDSYTFGDGVTNEQAFPTVLQEEDLGSWEVLNLGVSGYGPDQALLMYEVRGIKYHPDVVVYGFYPRGFFRLFMRFRSYAKPYFLLTESGQLTLENVPVISPDALYAEYASGRRRIAGWPYSYLLGTLGRRITQTFERKRIRDRTDESWHLMAALLRRFRDEAIEAGARPFLLVFPIRPGKYEDTVYEDLNRLAQEEARSLGIPCLALAERFLAQQERAPGELLFRDPEAGGHLSVQGNRLVAKLLYEALQESGILSPKEQGG
jgi:hypothetical protein